MHRPCEMDFTESLEQILEIALSLSCQANVRDSPISVVLMETKKTKKCTKDIEEFWHATNDYGR